MRKWLGWIERVLLGLATIALIGMMLLISLDAMGRYFFDQPLQGSFEFTSLFLMVILVFATMSHNYSTGRHVRLDVLSGVLERRLDLYYPRLIALLCLPVFAFLAYVALDELAHKWNSGESHAGLPISIALSYGWVALGALTLSLRMMLDIVSPQPMIVASTDEGETA